MDCSDLLKRASCPFIFNGFIDHWPAKHWTPVYLAKVLQERRYRCKIAPRNSADQVWETDCAYIEASLSEFCEWSIGQCKRDNPLHDVDRSKFSCYVDYKYMPQMFEDKPHLMKGVDWSVLGLSGRDGEESTIWVGSAGAATPCHYDTYGFNLVAQLHGKKRWHLFPPSSDFMYPTRLPYEESSVFSEVNVGQPDLERTPDFVKCQGIVVTLCPGDVLYVPRHWWHYVECLETAVSINTWVEVPDDDKSKLNEAVTRATVSCLVSSEAGESLQDWINPNEEIASIDKNWTYLWKSMNKVINNKSIGTSNLTNLHIFSSFFEGKHYKQILAPWDVRSCEHNNKTTDADQPMTVLTAKKRRHSLEEQEKSKRTSNSEHNFIGSADLENEVQKQKEPSLVDNKVNTPNLKVSETFEGTKQRIDQGSRSSNSEYIEKGYSKGVFALQTSSFRTYWKVAHGDRGDIWNMFENETRQKLLQSSSEHLQNSVSSKIESVSTPESLQGSAWEHSELEGGHSHTSEGTSRVTSCAQECSGQRHSDHFAAQSSSSGQLYFESDHIDICVPRNNGQGKTHSGQLTTLSTASEQSPCKDDHIHQPLDSGPLSTKREDSIDLCAVRDMYFRTLLHPNVVKVMAEELLKKFKK